MEDLVSAKRTQIMAENMIFKALKDGEFDLFVLVGNLESHIKDARTEILELYNFLERPLILKN
jgi:hypothetical protein